MANVARTHGHGHEVTITKADIEDRRAALIERGTAIRILLDTTDDRRRTRATDVQILKAVESRETGAVRATVQSASDPGTTYTVALDGPTRGRVRSYSCTCPDHDRHGRVCKHIAAVADKYLTTRREEFRMLRTMEQMFGL